VSIDGNSGVTRIKNLGRGQRAILTILAGPYAQKRHAPGSHWRSRSHTGFSSDCDFDIVTDLIFERHGKGKAADRYWKCVEAYAEQLVEDQLRSTLSRRRYCSTASSRATFVTTFRR